MATFGCVVNATPPVEAPGVCVNATCAAGPTVTLKVALVAVSVVPRLHVLGRQRVVVALGVDGAAGEVEMTPAASDCEQPDRVPGPVPVVTARLTVDVSVVTGLPPASSTVICGWVAKAVHPGRAARLLR